LIRFRDWLVTKAVFEVKYSLKWSLRFYLSGCWELKMWNICTKDSFASSSSASYYSSSFSSSYSSFRHDWYQINDNNKQQANYWSSLTFCSHFFRLYLWLVFAITITFWRPLIYYIRMYNSEFRWILCKAGCFLFMAKLYSFVSFTVHLLRTKKRALIQATFLFGHLLILTLSPPPNWTI